MVELPGRGSTFVTDSGPADAPAIILQHSVMTTGLLCWYPVIPELNQRYRVITLDHRWHDLITEFRGGSVIGARPAPTPKHRDPMEPGAATLRPPRVGRGR